MSRFDEPSSSSGRGKNRGSNQSMTVPPLIACESVTISWTGETPFHVTVLEADDSTGKVVKDFGETSASSTNWSVDDLAGREVIFALSDASGQVTFSDPQPIQPGPNCAPRLADDVLPEVFETPSTRYQVFSTPSSLSSTFTELEPSSSAFIASTEPPFEETSTTILESTSTSSTVTSSSAEEPTTSIQVITLTETRPPGSSTSAALGTGRSGDDVSSTSFISQDLVQASTLSSGLTEKGGSKTGIAVGITLGMGIPLLLIFLAYWLHRRRSERASSISSLTTNDSLTAQVEGPYASFSDLHSRPESSYTSRSASSFYSLGTEVMIARPAPPVPPIPAAMAEKRRSSITSFGLPYQNYQEREMENLSPFADLYGAGARDQKGRGGSEMGDSVYGGIAGRH